MENGSMVRITCSSYGAPMFPDEWVRGDVPPLLKGGTVGILLDSKFEADKHDPRRFVKILTPQGIGWINAVYCAEIG